MKSVFSMPGGGGGGGGDWLTTLLVLLAILTFLPMILGMLMGFVQAIAWYIVGSVGLYILILIVVKWAKR